MGKVIIVMFSFNLSVTVSDVDRLLEFLKFYIRWSLFFFFF